MKVCIIHAFISSIIDVYIYIYITLNLWTGIHNDSIIHVDNN
jgi:hypothetical protein